MIENLIYLSCILLLSLMNNVTQTELLITGIVLSVLSIHLIDVDLNYDAMIDAPITIYMMILYRKYLVRF